jgi:SAM-dependent methyltransferase
MSEANSMNFAAAANAFDNIASSYDDLFTQSVIGRSQRNQVWQRLLFAFQSGQRVLELNCGTGEDARFLAHQGISVCACDASSVMIEVAAGRGKLEPGYATIKYQRLANEDLSFLIPEGPFDGAFSNFSGLNCLADLQPVARNLATLIRPGGRVLICLWSRVCVAELLWFLLHGKINKAFRRFSGKATARVGGLTIEVSYPTTGRMRQIFAPWFRLEWRSAIGLFVPPSYYEPWVNEHGEAFVWLEKLDQMCSTWPVFRDCGDHVLLEFVRCNT